MRYDPPRKELSIVTGRVFQRYSCEKMRAPRRGIAGLRTWPFSFLLTTVWGVN